MRVGITGHQGLSERCAELVQQRIAELLDDIDDLVGLTSLARGADQLFAETVLAAAGQLIVVLPCDRYETSFENASALTRFEALLPRASSVIRMPFREPSEEAYWRAGQEIVQQSDLLLAVWDGQPAGGLGGTADVVDYARSQDTTVRVIWPEGCDRE